MNYVRWVTPLLGALFSTCCLLGSWGCSFWYRGGWAWKKVWNSGGFKATKLTYIGECRNTWCEVNERTAQDMYTEYSFCFQRQKNNFCGSWSTSDLSRQTQSCKPLATSPDFVGSWGLRNCEAANKHHMPRRFSTETNATNFSEKFDKKFSWGNAASLEEVILTCFFFLRELDRGWLIWMYTYHVYIIICTSW